MNLEESIINTLKKDKGLTIPEIRERIYADLDLIGEGTQITYIRKALKKLLDSNILEKRRFGKAFRYYLIKEVPEKMELEEINFKMMIEAAQDRLREFQSVLRDIDVMKSIILSTRKEVEALNNRIMKLKGVDLNTIPELLLAMIPQAPRLTIESPKTPKKEAVKIKIKTPAITKYNPFHHNSLDMPGPTKSESKNTKYTIVIWDFPNIVNSYAYDKAGGNNPLSYADQSKIRAKSFTMKQYEWLMDTYVRIYPHIENTIHSTPLYSRINDQIEESDDSVKMVVWRDPKNFDNGKTGWEDIDQKIKDQLWNIVNKAKRENIARVILLGSDHTYTEPLMQIGERGIPIYTIYHQNCHNNAYGVLKKLNNKFKQNPENNEVPYTYRLYSNKNMKGE